MHTLIIQQRKAPHYHMVITLRSRTREAPSAQLSSARHEKRPHHLLTNQKNPLSHRRRKRAPAMTKDEV
ncbi:hypothetical protein HBI72_171170 [Parastagonospora nodorum]|nr:hypothetical protein HBI72_171170 [Parastagonospora nodorum]